MARGHFYPLPPPFIGGRQPYAPSLGLPQSGPVSQAPPPRSFVNLNVITQAWTPAFFQAQGYADIASNIPAPVVSNPPPVNRAWMGSILQAYANQQWTVIYTASIAPVLATPPQIDTPPPSTNVRLMTVIRSWDPGPPRPPALKGIGQFTVPVVPDQPPAISYANLMNIRAQWEPRKWWPLPALELLVPPSPPLPDAPPVVNVANLKAIVAQWEPRKWWPLPSLVNEIPPNPPAPSQPPVLTYQNLNIVVDQWKAPPARPVFQKQVSSTSGPIPVGANGEVIIHRSAHSNAHRRALRYAHGKKPDGT